MEISRCKRQTLNLTVFKHVPSFYIPGLVVINFGQFALYITASLRYISIRKPNLP